MRKRFYIIIGAVFLLAVAGLWVYLIKTGKLASKADLVTPAMTASSFYSWPSDSSFTTFAKIDGTQTDGKTISLAEDSTGGGASTNVNDLFSGTVIDSKLWSATSDISMLNNKLSINHIGKTPTSDLSSKFTLSGDFDAQVSYSDLVFSGNAFSAVGLRATGLTLPFNIESRYNGGGGVLFTDMLGVALAGTSTSGTFRIKRTGSTCSVYQNDGIHVWQQRDVGTGDVTIDIYGRDDNIGGSVQANFNDFKATSSSALAIKKYVTTGTATLENFAFKEGTVHIKNAVVDKTDNGGTVKIEYSTDNFDWKEDVKDLRSVAQLFIRVTLTTTDTAKTPVLSKISLEYVPVSAPAKPVLVSPLSGASVSNSKPELKASAFVQPDGATFSSSEWEIATSPTLTSTGKFKSPVPGIASTHDASTSYTSNMSLTPDKKYFWHVRYMDSYGFQSTWSDAGSFTVKSLEKPVNISPVPTQILSYGITGNPTLKASFMGNQATGTTWVIYTNEFSGSRKTYNGTASSSFKITETLPPATYAWSVQYWVSSPDNVSPWSDSTFFTVSALKAPSNTLPASGTQSVSLTPTLTANFNGQIPDRVNWKITTNLNDLVLDSPNLADHDTVDGSSNTFTIPESSKLEPDTAYYWLVWIEKGNNKSPLSKYTWFKTGALPAVYTAPKVTTLSPTDITAKSIVPHGKITDTGNYPITYRGFQYSKVNTGSALVSIYDSGKFGVGEYTKLPIISGLTANTTYYVRAFAINAKGTTYASWIQFKTLSTITATTSAGGTISPFGVTNLESGSSQNYIITANAGYKITDVKVDGQSVGAVGTYTFTDTFTMDVSSNHTIAATFTKIAQLATAQGLVTSGDKVVAGATVKIAQDGATNGLFTTFYSDQNGVYKITGLSVASYYITVTAPVCTKYLIFTFCSNMQKTNYFTLTSGTNTVIPTFNF